MSLEDSFKNISASVSASVASGKFKGGTDAPCSSGCGIGCGNGSSCGAGGSATVGIGGIEMEALEPANSSSRSGVSLIGDSGGMCFEGSVPNPVLEGVRGRAPISDGMRGDERAPGRGGSIACSISSCLQLRSAGIPWLP